MPYTRQTQYRNRVFPHPLHIPETSGGFKNKESLLQLSHENRASGNLAAALMIELIMSFCAEDESWIQCNSSKPTSVWYQWGLVSWSPGVVTHWEDNRIVVSSRRRKRSSLAGSPHMGSERDHSELIYGHWFELLPRQDKSKPPSIINSLEFRRIQNEIRSVDSSWDLSSSHEFFDDIGNRLVGNSLDS